MSVYCTPLCGCNGLGWLPRIPGSRSSGKAGPAPCCRPRSSKSWRCGGRLGDPPALDPVADLKLHQLELVEAIRERQALMQARRAS